MGEMGSTSLFHFFILRAMAQNAETATIPPPSAPKKTISISVVVIIVLLYTDKKFYSLFYHKNDKTVKPWDDRFSFGIIGLRLP